MLENDKGKRVTKAGPATAAVVLGLAEVPPYAVISESLAKQSFGNADPLDKQVETVGRPHAHVEIKIVDPETGAIVPRGTPGEQCTRGYNVMLGYWNNAEATRDAIDVRRRPCAPAAAVSPSAAARSSCRRRAP